MDFRGDLSRPATDIIQALAPTNDKSPFSKLSIVME